MKSAMVYINELNHQKGLMEYACKIYGITVEDSDTIEDMFLKIINHLQILNDFKYSINQLDKRITDVEEIEFIGGLSASDIISK